MQFRHPLHPWAISLENKFGKLAFPHSVRFLALFQLGVFCMSALFPGYESLLSLDAAAVKGEFELWRLVTFMFLFPPGTRPLFVIFTIIILMMISEGLERAWGAFRLNLFIFGIWLSMLTAVFVLPWLFPGIQSTVLALYLGYMAPAILNAALFCSFACNYPEHEIRLFLVIPVKMKWVGLLVGFMLVGRMVVLGSDIGQYAASSEGSSVAGEAGDPAGGQFTGSIAGLAFLSVSVIPFLLVFLPNFIWWLRHRQKTAARKAKFNATQLKEDEAFHTCAKCGISDIEDPELDFFIEDDDEEYCEKCLR
ncbi:MAG: hypothetical protein ACI8UO_003584 [Verrucomicrobiales bacterium]|jgi:hypothetical protein